MASKKKISFSDGKKNLDSSVLQHLTNSLQLLNSATLDTTGHTTRISGRHSIFQFHEQFAFHVSSSFTDHHQVHLDKITRRNSESL